MAAFVYILCAVTSLLCGVLLLRRYQSARLRLLLWSGVAFFCFTAGNVILYIDLVLLPQIDLTLWRSLFSLAGVLLLLGVLISEARGGTR